MDGILPLNELEKVKKRSFGRGFGTTIRPDSAWGPNGYADSPFALVDAKRMLVTGFALDTGIHTRTVQDHRLFNHGGGQFSYASALWTILRTAPETYSTEIYVKPFTVNQTTGAITEGTGARIWGNIGNTTGFTSTMAWGISGNYLFNFGDLPGPPNLTYNSGVLSACTVSNNQVSGQAFINYGTSSVPIRSYDNYMMGVTRANGDNTAYVVPNAYQEDATPSYVDLVASYNGTTLTTVRNTKGAAVTNSPAAVGEARTHYLVSNISQYNAGPFNSSTLGVIRVRLDANGYQRLDLLNNTGVVTATLDTAFCGGLWDRPFNAWGFDLSNGRQIIFTECERTLVRIGNTLTDVSGADNWIDVSRNDFGYYTTPVGPDTWVTVSTGGDRQWIKFTINPTTYKVTIIDSFYNRTVMRGQNWDFGVVWPGAGVTGTNNQFLVQQHDADRSFWPTIRVYKNPLTGAG
jgi:hypothetical protein